MKVSSWVKVSPFVFVREESLLNVIGTWTWLLFSSKLFYLWGLFVDVVHRVAELNLCMPFNRVVLLICVVVVCG